MAKQFVLRVIFDLIFLALFNVFFFTLAGTEDRTAAVWVSYCFIHFAYLMFLLTRFMIRKGKSAAVFSFSLYSISLVYFFTELVAGTVFILISPDSYKVALLVQLSIAAIYGVMTTLHMIANERTADAEERRQPQIAYIKEASVKLKNVLENISDREVKKNVEKVYDAIYSSPVKSHSSMSDIEDRIFASINELERMAKIGNKDDVISLANSILSSINERNGLARSL